MANSVKLQVAVDGSEGKLPFGESLIDHLHDLFQLLFIVRVELPDRPQQLLDQNVIDLEADAESTLRWWLTGRAG